MALATDIVIAARSAKFIHSFSKVGLIPDSGGTWILPRHLGMARAMGLALLGESLTAEQAYQTGLIWSCVDDRHLPQQAAELVNRLAEMPTLGLGLTKKAIQQSHNHSLLEQLELEAQLQGEAGRSEDYSEGVRSFLEKRSPNFKGK